MIAAVLLGLTLILLTRRREFLSATATIKDPRTWTDEDYQRVRTLVPELTAKRENSEKELYKIINGVEIPTSILNQKVKAEFESNLRQAWTDLYVPATTPLTTGDIDNFLAPMSGMLDLNAIKTLHNKYFETVPGAQRNQVVYQSIPLESPITAMFNTTPTPSAAPSAAPAATPAAAPSAAPAATPAAAAPPPTAIVSPQPSQPVVEGSVVTTIASLEGEYKDLKSEYESVVSQALATTRKEELSPLMDRILSLNSKITVVLEQLIGKLAADEQKGSTNFTNKRNEFALRLSQIKKEYGDLVSDNDRLTTLRRIRQYEESKATSGLRGYLLAFGIAVSLLIVMVFYKMFQPKKSLYTPNPTPASPAISTDLNM